MDKAKIATIFTLIAVLVIMLIGYYLIARGNETLTGGFISTATYLIKKIADQVDEIIDKLWGIEHKEPKTEEKTQ